MPAAVGVDVNNAAVGGADERFYLACERNRIARDVARPLNAEAVRGAVFDAVVNAVPDIVDVPHDDGSAVRPALCRLLVKMPRDVLEQVQSERFGKDLGDGTQECGVPIAVVPPCVQPERQEFLQFLLAVAHLFGIEHVLGARNGFGMVVEHDLHPVRVRKRKEAAHIGEEFGIDIVTDAAVRRRAPIGIDDHLIERDIILLVVKDDLLCALLAVFVVLGIPRAEHGEPHQGTPARQLHIKAAQLFCVAPAEQQVDVAHIFFDDVSAVLQLPSVGIAACGDADARRIGERENFGRLCGGRQFARVGQFAAAVYRPVLPQEDDAADAAPAARQKEFVRAEGKPCAAARLGGGKLRTAFKVPRGDKERFLVAELRAVRILDAHDVLRKKLHAEVARPVFSDHNDCIAPFIRCAVCANRCIV